MSMKENAQTIAENVPKVYEAGDKARLSDMWESIQFFGNKAAYSYAFEGFNSNNFYPKYDIIIGGKQMAGEARSLGAFRNFNNRSIDKPLDLAERLEECGVILDTSTALDMTYFFMSCKISRLPTIDITSATSLYYAFYNIDLITIDKLIVAKRTPFNNNTFQNAAKLENLTIEGEIGKANFNVHWSTKLTHDSLMSIINALADYSADTSGTSWVVTLGTENLNKLTDEEKAIATQKGWSIA